MGGIASAFNRLSGILRDASFDVHVLYVSAPYCARVSIKEQIRQSAMENIRFIALPRYSHIKLYGSSLMQVGSYRLHLAGGNVLLGEWARCFVARCCLLPECADRTAAELSSVHLSEGA
jgi:hypothetical protein